MASTSKTDFQYKNFDPVNYVREYYVRNDTILEDCLKLYYEVYSSDKLKGTSLLDLGTGPSIHWLAAPSRNYTEITVSDLVERNLLEVNKWLQKDPGAIDWTRDFKWSAAAEHISDHTVIEERVRKAVKDVIICDVLQENPLLNFTKQYDAVQSTFGVDCSAQDQESLKLILKNVSNVLKPDGALVMISPMQGTYYEIGSHIFPITYVTKDILEDALSEAGFVDIKFREITRDYSCQRPCDYKGVILSTAFKKV